MASRRKRGWSHTHTRNVLQVLARGLVREVNFLSAAPDLARQPLPPRPGPRRREPLLSSGIACAGTSSPHDEKRDGKTRGAIQGAQILAGVALRSVGGDFPDTEICLRREPPHPREALPTSDIDFPGENRIEVYLRYSTNSGKGGRERDDYFLSSLFVPTSLSLSSSYLLFFSFHIAMDDLLLFKRN